VRHVPNSGIEQDRNFRGPDRHEHVNYHRDGGEASEQPQDKKHSAHDLANADEGSQDFRVRNSDLREAAHALRFWRQELLDAFREKDAADNQTNSASILSKTRHDDGDVVPATFFVRLSSKPLARSAGFLFLLKNDGDPLVGHHPGEAV
jgi:hypothetical protein